MTEPNQPVQRTGQIEHQRPLTPVADLVVMRTRSKTLIAGAVCLIVAALAVRLSRTAQVPAYNGRPLGDWFHELPVTSIRPGLVMTSQSVTLLGRTYGNSQVQPRESLSAIQRIGTNGIPFLMQKLSWAGFPCSKQLYAIALRAGMKRALFADPELERGQAATALLALPSLPESAVERLRKLSSNTNSNIGATAAYILNA